uniref:Uncharacterized protein n=1 Tax=Cucumis melo TaxID=3656 RepID=A0A9I9CFM6_CUCME
MKLTKFSEVRMELFECSRLTAAVLFASRVVVRVDLRQSSSAVVVRVDRRRSSSVVIVRVSRCRRSSATVVIRGYHHFSLFIVVVAAMVLG